MYMSSWLLNVSVLDWMCIIRSWKRKSSWGEYITAWLLNYAFEFKCILRFLGLTSNCKFCVAPEQFELVMSFRCLENSLNWRLPLIWGNYTEVNSCRRLAINMSSGIFWFVSNIILEISRALKILVIFNRTFYLDLDFSFWTSLYVAACVMLVDFCILTELCSFDFVGKEGKVCLPHTEYAQCWCNKEMPCRWRLVSSFCNNSGLFQYFNFWNQHDFLNHYGIRCKRKVFEILFS